MSIVLKKYYKKNAKQWDDFVKSSSNGTIFHLRQFLTYHINRHFNDNSLIFKKNDSIIAVFPATKIVKNEKNILFSHPGASYGGFVYDNITYDDAEKIIELLDQYCFDTHFNEIFFIPTPIIYDNKKNDTLNYLLYRNDFQIMEVYISSVIKIEKNKTALNYLNKRKKRYIQNYISNNNFQIKCINNFSEFYPVLLKNKKKHNVLPTHSLEELEVLNNLFPKNLYLLLLYHNNKLIGGVLNIIANKNCGIMFYNMIDYKHKEFQAASIQIYESIKWAKKFNLKYLDLGVSQKPQSSDPLEPHKSLINFKEQFDSTAILRIAIQKSY